MIFSKDICLKILFPQADYYINNVESCTMQYRIESNSHYNIINNYDFSMINDANYDILFIILPIYDTVKNESNAQKLSNKIQSEIINVNNFKKIFIFDNYDYDYDPSLYFVNDKIDLYFKRNYNKNKIYNEKVVSFPFIMFGEISNVEKCDRQLVSKEIYFSNKQNRIFFTESLFKHEDLQYGIVRDRRAMYYKIRHEIYNPGHLNYYRFMNEIRNSKFSLDLLGCGEPNKRTFEILLSGSLLISEINDLKWPFDETFSSECFFTGPDDFANKILALRNDEQLYNKCLMNQYNIVKKYFNVNSLRNYIVNYMN